MRFGLVLAAAAVLYGCDASPSPPDASSLTNKALPPSSETTEATSSVSAAETLKIPPDLATRCGIADCPAGTKVITASVKDGPFYSCPNEALSNYIAMVLGTVAMQQQITGTVPNIDPTTGEPVYQGQTAQIMTSLRVNAGVETFDEAVAHCQRGPYRQASIVMNYDKDRLSTWVSNDPATRSFWLPTSELDIRRK